MLLTGTGMMGYFLGAVLHFILCHRFHSSYNEISFSCYEISIYM